MSDTKTDILRFVSGHAGGADIAGDEDLFDSGLVNSLFIVQLVMWLERGFGITLAGGDLDLDNFRTVDAITAFVARKSTPVST
ncbi:Phosphopantetheine attachment site [Amycolatopsis lurida]|uniref:Carrier domain-containing protein n=1 Tax=Amycolatopsis lurida NRRL 2430 TaxID=1460371 RepID=A0A2P2FZC9_AMYLU|nr:phosphopantetheine-binding protein [Amycolatopsis lurida]KFU82067.1 hypothetical protein BB31_06940 [Amycolatopsis lurida NRRL 2430]SEC44191.1 Phosphopantetheine attachment site [Amycolatopsis lurida]